VRWALALAALALAGAGCAAAAPTAPDRSALIREILASTVQLRSERDGAIRRAASGVVVAVDPGTQRTWIITARHFVDPSPPQNVYVRLPGRITVMPATVAFVSADRDLALIEAQYLDVSPARLKMAASLGDEVLVITFPWGQRFTVVRGIVSQVSALNDVSGPARMVDASVSYGSSGGGVFDARTGELVGIVESYRTAKVAIPEMKERVLEVPVAGETTLISAQAIQRFLLDSGLNGFLPR
jgi:S1-C subfamily serine protease